MSTPLITIGITCYNAANTITKAIESALDQDWPNIEIVIVDDGSTDETKKFLEEMETEHPSLRIFRQEKNKGVAAARNKIIKESQGEFIAFFDDDDVSLPNRLSQQYKRLVNYEKDFAQGAPVLCHTVRLQRYPDGRELIVPTAGCTEGRIAPHGHAMAQRLLTGKPCQDGYGAMATCSQMARKSIYEQLGGFDEKLRRSEDTDLTIRHAQIGGHFIGIVQPLVIQKMTMSNDKNLEQELSCTLQYMKKHQDLFPSPRSYNFHCAWVKAKYDYFKGHKKSLLYCFLTHPILSLKKLYWASPTHYHNRMFKAFYKGEKS